MYTLKHTGTAQPYKVLGTLTAQLAGRTLAQQYRAILKLSEYDGQPVVVVQQLCDGADNWRGTGGQWYLSTLLENPTDAISIDYGQRWGIQSGLLAALTKAQESTQ